MKAITAVCPALRPVPASPLTAVNLEHLWAIFRDLRELRSLHGLGAGPLQSLQAMISFLRDGRPPIVFASNRSLALRAGGIDERTLRRHAARLAAAGLIARQDSPNGKRYKIADPESHDEEIFGFTLEPLIRQGEMIAEAAREQRAMESRRLFLRKKLLRLLTELEAALPDFVLGLRKLMRRKLDVASYESAIAEAEAAVVAQSAELTSEPPELPETSNLPASDGHPVRHLSMSEKKDMDSDMPRDMKEEPVDHESCNNLETDILRTAVASCSEAMSFATEPVRSGRDLEALARDLAPMMGIDRACYEAACQRQPWPKVALTVMTILQMGSRIRNMPAYFRSVLLGRRAESFDVLAVLRRLPRAAPQPAC